jgi:hypothetical protein
MTSEGGIGPDPNASAAIACAPPTRRRPSAPATYAAAAVTTAGRGEATHTDLHPATLAVITVISTLEGSGNLPPGRYQ